MALARTIAERPDLIEARGGLTPEEESLLSLAETEVYPRTSPGNEPRSRARHEPH
jgi:hypothetical protein